MNLMKFLHGLCIFYMTNLLVCSSVLAQSEVCTFSDSGIEGVEVGQIGDRQIYTLFTEHLTGDQQDTTRAVLTSRLNYTPLQFTLRLDWIIGRYMETVVSEQFDVQRITELAESGQIDWIGVEGSLSELGGNAFAEMVSSYSKLKSELDNLNLSDWDSSKTEQILSLSFNEIIIAYANYSEIFDRIPIVPLEDNNLRRESGRLVTEIRRMGNALLRGELIVEEVLEGTITFSQVAEFNYTFSSSNHISNRAFEDLLGIFFENPEIEEQQTPMSEIPIPVQIRPKPLKTALIPAPIPALTPASTSTRAELQMFLRTLINKHNALIGLYDDREQKIVQSILNQPGNGLLIFGADHGPGIKEGLVTACRNGNGSP